MSKNLIWKLVFIAVLTLYAIYILTPPQDTLKPGIDLAGGTSIIFEIDSHNMSAKEKSGLSAKMIEVLRRRIDPANIQNLIWRPQGNTRFEIQMPLADAQARHKREVYNSELTALLADNINPALILRALNKPADERQTDFEKFANGSSEKLAVLTELAEAFDEQKQLRMQRDTLSTELEAALKAMEDAAVDTDAVKLNASEWAKLPETQLLYSINAVVGETADANVVSNYIRKYAEWSDVLDKLTNIETGANIRYTNARKNLGKFSITEDQLNLVLETPRDSAKRMEAYDKLKEAFPDRAESIQRVVNAYDIYSPVRGGLDDPKDLLRLIKGAGILEFRILPTTDPDTNPDSIDIDILEGYVEALKEKGPTYASDQNYIWVEVESLDEFYRKVKGAVLGQFGEKFYVLASNKQDEIIVHNREKDWKLVDSRPTVDQSQRRAISFTVDERGGRLFSNVSRKNVQRPLCIILDDLAISAPSISTERLYKRNIITGSFSRTEVEDMVKKLNAGSLPAKLIEQPISVNTIGPAIGADNRDKGVKAGLIGLLAVIILMGLYYRLPGVVADIALLLNMLFVLAIMAMIKATFTLPGIAGLILTIGMSVDANVLIFERIREEQQRGSSLRIAIRNGYGRAFRTILDANLTTFITAFILFWVASEEIKGFAIVLMLGIGSSMFTALFITRVIFDLLTSSKVIKDKLSMMLMFRKPNINWMNLRTGFVIFSLILIFAGLTVFLTRDDMKNNKYDIEFTGGTSVQINLTEESTRQQVQEKFIAAAEKRGNPALKAANIYSVGKSNKQFVITTTQTNKTSATVMFPTGSGFTPEAVKSGINKIRSLSKLTVTQGESADTFIVTTSLINKNLVKDTLQSAFENAEISDPVTEEIVNDAVVAAFEGQLEILQNLDPEITSSETVNETLIESYPELAEFIGGIKIQCNINNPTAFGEIETRFKDLRFKADARDLVWYPYIILGQDLNPVDQEQKVTSFVYISVEPEASYRELSSDEWRIFTENESQKIIAAASLETSLPRVTQIDPSIGAESKTKALIAIILSLIAIVGYIWVRFGNARYGFAAIVALVHDVCITLGAVVSCTYLANTAIGSMLLVGDFKIDLAIIAAFLTIIGYSLNDTIVVFDRIRENRQRAQLKTNIINESINQTLSRTLMTSITTLVVVVIMYIWGGEGLRGFTFSIALGILVGTYSSVAIAAPILLLGIKSSDSKSKAKAKKNTR